MEENKKQTLKDVARQKKLPPRPMPPRPPLMKKQIVEEGKTLNSSENKPPYNALQNQNTNDLNEQNVLSKTKELAKKKKHKKAKNKFNKKKFWIAMGSFFAGVGLVVGMVFLILAKLPSKPLDAPQNLKITSNDQAVFATCDKVVGASKYIFEIDGKKYDSKTPSLDLTRFVEPKEYKIKVYAIGDKNESLSKSSKEIKYDLRKKLQAPVIRFYEIGSNIVCWSEVENATGYELFFNNQTKDLGNALSIDLNTFGAGEYYIQVRAKTTKAGYVDSEHSNMLKKAVYEKLQQISGRVLKNGRIEITKVKNASRYIVTINEKTFEVEKFDDEKYIVDLKVAGIFSTTVTYFKIEAVGENYYISNSAQIDTTVAAE